MKSFTVVCLFALVAITFAKGGTYTDRFDHINLDEILDNRRTLIPYLKCVLGQGVCTAEGKELKAHIQDALETNCAKCTDAQKRGSRKVLEHLINNEPGYWDQLVAKYDPHHRFTHKYEQELKKIKH